MLIGRQIVCSCGNRDGCDRLYDLCIYLCPFLLVRHCVVPLLTFLCPFQTLSGAFVCCRLAEDRMMKVKVSVCVALALLAAMGMLRL